jgi:hypothetical protein
VCDETELPTKADFASEIPTGLSTLSLGSGMTYETNMRREIGVIPWPVTGSGQTTNWLNFR